MESIIIISSRNYEERVTRSETKSPHSNVTDVSPLQEERGGENTTIIWLTIAWRPLLHPSGALSAFPCSLWRVCRHTLSLCLYCCWKLSNTVWLSERTWGGLSSSQSFLYDASLRKRWMEMFKGKEDICTSKQPISCRIQTGQVSAWVVQFNDIWI